MKKIFIFLIIVGILFLIFLLFSYLRGANNEKAYEKEVSFPKKKLSLVWNIGSDVDMDLTKNRLIVSAKGSYPRKETATEAQAEELALRTARHLAYEKLAETIKGIRVVSYVTYKELFPKEEQLKTELNALIQGAKIDKEEIKKDKEGNSVGIVTLSIPLYEKEKGFLTRLISFFKKGEIGIAMEGFSLKNQDSSTKEPVKTKVEGDAVEVKRENEVSIKKINENLQESNAREETKKKVNKSRLHFTGVIFTMEAHLENLSALPRILDNQGNVIVNFITDVSYEIYESGFPIVDDIKDPLIKNKVGRYPFNLRLSSSPHFPGDLVTQQSLNEDEKDLIYSLVSKGKFIFFVKGE